MKKNEKVKKASEQEPPKATVTEPITTSETTGTNTVAEVKKISLIETDFGRGDLNLMRDKINEIINNGN